MKRPTLEVGDVVKLSKRALFLYPKLRNNSMVVLEAYGDTSDGVAHIKCMYFSSGRTRVGHFARRNLWKTNYNVKQTAVSNEQSLKNNGRETCIKCGKTTKVIQGFSSLYNICNNPKCRMYNQ